MNLDNVEKVKKLFKQYNLRPQHYLGQNFLVDEDVLNQIVKAADLKLTDTVLEVGPGLGVLTQELIKKSGKVIAVEKDEKFVSVLKNTFSIASNLEIINADILRFNFSENIKSPYKVVANIPYYLTSKLIQLFLEANHAPELLVLMIQKEVGERVVANPGELSVLGISVQIYADVEIVAQVPKIAFWPTPQVDSVILKIVPKNKYPQIKDKKLFFRLVKTAFAGKRKQLKNTIKDPEALKVADIDPMKRPQDLSIEDWIRLYIHFEHREKSLL